MARTKSSPEQPQTNGPVGWQAQKSAMTRDTILEATIDCFINLGYPNTTSARIADHAGVSRGAMLHHFPSRAELIHATIKYLHAKLLQEYTREYTKKMTRLPENLSWHERIRAGLEAYWNYLTSDLFVAYHELCVAGRTDPELGGILQQTLVDFDRHVSATNLQLFPEWADKGEQFALAMDLTKFLMEGMAVGQMAEDRKARIARVLDSHAERLLQLFEQGRPESLPRL
jgi:AcrR family transcriptional regulator